ncbi:MAG: diaminopimelate epimerase [bacterium]
MIQFTKMHGLGNDYVVVDERDQSVIPEDRKGEFARDAADRGFGIGSDGILYLSTPDTADLQMRIFNADGSEAESCGNGLRCAAYYHHGLNKSGESTFTINLPLSDVIEASVNHTLPNQAEVRLSLPEAGRYVSKETVDLETISLVYHRIDVGNPHAVIFLEENDVLEDQLDELPLDVIGPQIQNHPDFEDTGGINAEFVRVDDGENVTMRVHERGVGETSSCGTGCIGVARACAATDRKDGWISVHQPGGILRIETEKGFLEGSTEHVYTGYYPRRLEDV